MNSICREYLYNISLISNVLLNTLVQSTFDPSTSRKSSANTYNIMPNYVISLSIMRVLGDFVKDMTHCDGKMTAPQANKVIAGIIQLPAFTALGTIDRVLGQSNMSGVPPYWNNLFTPRQIDVDPYISNLWKLPSSREYYPQLVTIIDGLNNLSDINDATRSLKWVKTVGLQPNLFVDDLVHIFSDVGNPFKIKFVKSPYLVRSIIGKLDPSGDSAEKEFKSSPKNVVSFFPQLELDELFCQLLGIPGIRISFDGNSITIIFLKEDNTTFDITINQSTVNKWACGNGKKNKEIIKLLKGSNYDDIFKYLVVKALGDMLLVVLAFIKQITQPQFKTTIMTGDRTVLSLAQLLRVGCYYMGSERIQISGTPVSHYTLKYYDPMGNTSASKAKAVIYVLCDILNENQNCILILKSYLDYVSKQLSTTIGFRGGTPESVITGSPILRKLQIILRLYSDINNLKTDILLGYLKIQNPANSAVFDRLDLFTKTKNNSLATELDYKKKKAQFSAKKNKNLLKYFTQLFDSTSLTTSDVTLHLKSLFLINSYFIKSGKKSGRYHLNMKMNTKLSSVINATSQYIFEMSDAIRGIPDLNIDTYLLSDQGGGTRKKLLLSEKKNRGLRSKLKTKVTQKKEKKNERKKRVNPYLERVQDRLDINKLNEVDLKDDYDSIFFYGNEIPDTINPWYLFNGIYLFDTDIGNLCDDHALDRNTKTHCDTLGMCDNRKRRKSYSSFKQERGRSLASRRSSSPVSRRSSSSAPRRSRSPPPRRSRSSAPRRSRSPPPRRSRSSAPRRSRSVRNDYSNQSGGKSNISSEYSTMSDSNSNRNSNDSRDAKNKTINESLKEIFLKRLGIISSDLKDENLSKFILFQSELYRVFLFENYDWTKVLTQVNINKAFESINKGLIDLNNEIESEFSEQSKKESLQDITDEVSSPGVLTQEKINSNSAIGSSINDSQNSNVKSNKSSNYLSESQMQSQTQSQSQSPVSSKSNVSGKKRKQKQTKKKKNL